MKLERQRKVSSFRVKEEKKTSNLDRGAASSLKWDEQNTPPSLLTMYLVSTVSLSLYSPRAFLFPRPRDWYRKVIFDRSNIDRAERNLFFRADARRWDIEMRSSTTILSHVSASPVCPAISSHYLSRAIAGTEKRGGDDRIGRNRCTVTRPLQIRYASIRMLGVPRWILIACSRVTCANGSMHLQEANTIVFLPFHINTFRCYCMFLVAAGIEIVRKVYLTKDYNKSH